MSIKIDVRIPDAFKRVEKELDKLKNLEVGIGYIRGTTEENGADLVDVAMWNEYGTIGMPSRPFMQNSFDNNESEIKAFMDQRLDEVMNGGSAEETMKKIGVFQKGNVQSSILDGSYAPNAASTILKKGSSKPLVDTSTMLQSVQYVVRPKGSGE